MIQGTQKIYVLTLRYWGAAISKSQGTVSVVMKLNSLPCVMCGVGVVLFVGQPTFYRPSPSHVPAFYLSVFRLKYVPYTSHPLSRVFRRLAMAILPVQ